MWHRRLGHTGLHSYKQLVSGGMLNNFSVTAKQVAEMQHVPCDACNRAKAQRLSFPKESQIRVHAPLGRLHLDLMGPFDCRVIRGEYYILCLVDQFSDFAAVVPLKKSEAPLIVQTIILQWLTALTGFVFKVLRSDRAKEFI